jgi:hypothetical protein
MLTISHRIQVRDTFDGYLFFCPYNRFLTSFMVISIAPCFHILRSLQSMAPGGPVRLAPDQGLGHPAVSPIWSTSYCAWYWFKRIGAGSACLLSRSKKTEATGRDKGGDSPRPTTDVAKDKVIGDKEEEKEK